MDLQCIIIINVIIIIVNEWIRNAFFVQIESVSGPNGLAEVRIW